MNESFISVHDALQTRLEEWESHITRLEVLKGNQAVEISKLKEEVKRLEGELRSHD